MFRYDVLSGLYNVEEYGEPYIDGNDGSQVAHVRNGLAGGEQGVLKIVVVAGDPVPVPPGVLQ